MHKKNILPKKLAKLRLPAILTVSILMIGILSSTNVLAQQSENYPPIVQKIADKFNLNINEVQEVFDEERDEHRADMYANFAERLNDLVSEGKLTDTQKELILDKHEEMQDQIESLRNLSHQERMNKMGQIHEEFQNWADQQGIDLSLIGSNGMGPRRGFKMGHMMGNN